MKKIILLFLLMAMLACGKEGEVLNKSKQHIKINGKEYYFLKVVPADGEKAVWLLIPVDASVELPELTSYKVSCGRNCYRMQNCIWINKS